MLLKKIKKKGEKNVWDARVGTKCAVDLERLYFTLTYNANKSGISFLKIV